MGALLKDDYLSKAENHFRYRGYPRTAGRLKILRKIRNANDVNVSSLIAPIIDDAIASDTFRSLQNGRRNSRPFLEEAVSTSMMIQSSKLVPELDGHVREIAEKYIAEPVGSDRLDHLWAVYDPEKDDASAAFGAIPLIIATYNEVWKPCVEMIRNAAPGLEEVTERVFSVRNAVEKGHVRSDFGYVYDRCLTMDGVDVAGRKVYIGDQVIPAEEFVLWPRTMEITASILMDILVCIAARDEVLSRRK